MGNTPSNGGSRPPPPPVEATPAAPWDGPPVYAEAVPMDALPDAPPLAPEALSPSATAAPPLAHIVASLRLELGLSGSHVQVVDGAVSALGLPRNCGNGLVERARACWNLLHGEEDVPRPPPRRAPGSARGQARSPPAHRERLPAQYDLSVGDLVVAATAWKRVRVGDRGVVVGPCEDSQEKAPHKRCRVRFDDGKGTYVYTKGQQARRAPLAGMHVLGDGVLALTTRAGAFAKGDRGVVVGRGRRGTLAVKWATATTDVAPTDVAPAPVVAAPGAPAILKGDVVVASVNYETVKVGDRGVVVGPCSDPAMSRADLRVLVDFDGAAAYNYRCDTQLQLAPLLDGATFVRGDAVLVRGDTVRRGAVAGLGSDGRTLAVTCGDGTEDVAPADLAHAPLVADTPAFRKGARVVASVGYNAVRAGDRGVVVGPCNVLTMPNAAKRVLVDFGTGKGLYNYAAGTQLAVADGDNNGAFPALNGAP